MDNIADETGSSGEVNDKVQKSLQENRSLKKLFRIDQTITDFIAKMRMICNEYKCETNDNFYFCIPCYFKEENGCQFSQTKIDAWKFHFPFLYNGDLTSELHKLLDNKDPAESFGAFRSFNNFQEQLEQYSISHINRIDKFLQEKYPSEYRKRTIKLKENSDR